jgi:hypothetical protein
MVAHLFSNIAQFTLTVQFLLKFEELHYYICIYGYLHLIYTSLVNPRKKCLELIVAKTYASTETNTRPPGPPVSNAIM